MISDLKEEAAQEGLAKQRLQSELAQAHEQVLRMCVSLSSDAAALEADGMSENGLLDRLDHLSHLTQIAVSGAGAPSAAGVSVIEASVDGSWKDMKSMEHKAIIQGNQMIWSGSGNLMPKTVTLLDKTSTTLVVATKRGKLTGRLSEDGSLRWDDGDVWTKASQAKATWLRRLAGSCCGGNSVQ
jgi:hypothetical protein